MFYYMKNEDEKSSGDFMTSNGEYRDEARLVPYTHMSDGDTFIQLPDVEYKDIKVVHDMLGKKEYIIARKKTPDGILSEAEIRDAYNQLKVEGGKGLVECSFYNLSQEYAVVLCFDDYYEVESKTDEDMVWLSASKVCPKEYTVLICGNYEAQNLVNDVAKGYSEDGIVAYVAIPGPDGASEEDYLNLCEYLDADIFVRITIDESGLEDKPVVTGYCNSRYFIPELNSVTLTSGIVDGIARTGVMAVDGVYECSENDVVSKLHIPATSIIIRCKGQASYDNISNSQYYSRIVESFCVKNE